MAVNQEAYEAAKNGKPKEKNNEKNDRNCGDVDFATLLNIDVTADYEVGKAIIDKRVIAVGRGMRDRLKEVKGAMAVLTGGKFAIQEATYTPALPPSPEESQKSVLSLLFGSDLEVEEDGQG